MGGDIQRPFGGLESLDDPKTRLVNSTLGFLSIFECDADLVTEFRPLVFLELCFWLSKVVLEKIEETGVVFFQHTRIVQDKSTIHNQCISSLVTRQNDVDG